MPCAELRNSEPECRCAFAFSLRHWRLCQTIALPPSFVAMRLALEYPVHMQPSGSSTAPPNPSIEGTSNIWLRQLSAAPHVKR
jgi:hypothetical protein